MLYVIQALTEDRAAYYKLHPEYINPDAYQKSVEFFEKNKFFIYDDERNSFEWAARQLIGLEQEVNQANTEQEIAQCLEKFRGYYNRLCNHNLDLTICSCMSSSVFSLHYAMKPIIYHGIPSSLMSLAKDVGVIKEKISSELLFKDLAEFSSHMGYYPPAIPQAIDQLKESYLQLEKEINDQNIKNFLNLWYAIPLKETLSPSFQRNYPLENFKKLVTKLESQLGVSQSILNAGLKLLEQEDLELFIHQEGFSSKYPALFIPMQFDPEKALEQWKGLIQDLENFMIQFPQHIKSKQIKKFCKISKSTFKKEKKPLDLQQYPFKFEGLKEETRYVILFPFPELGNKIAAFKKALLQKEFRSLGDFENALDKLIELKHYIINNILERDQEAVQCADYVINALNFMERVEESLAKNILQEQNLSSDDRLKLIIRIGQERGFFQKDASPSSWQEAWKQDSQEKLLGYSHLRRWLINTPGIFDLIGQKGWTLDQALQTLQGSLNTGWTSLVDQLFVKEVSQQYLLGFASHTADVIGKLRWIKDQAFTPAQEGDILVVQDAKPDIHLYQAATAIISEQGGLFSHAAHTFSDLGIPALLGSNIEHLKSYDGQLIHLRLSSHTSSQVTNH